MITLLTKDGVVASGDNGWSKKEYILLVDGLPYRITGMTKSGNLIIEKRQEMQAQTAKQEAPQPSEHINSIKDVVKSLDWAYLRGRMYQYMYFKKNGGRTTPKDRNVLAERLSKSLGVSTTVAWNWSKPDAPMPRMENLRALSKFDFESNRL